MARSESLNRTDDGFEALQVLFLKLGSRSWIYREGTRNVWVVETTCRLDRGMTMREVRERAAFARGYFDAEGGIPRSGASSLLYPAGTEGSKGPRIPPSVAREARRALWKDPQPERSGRSGILEVLCPQLIARGLHPSRRVLAPEEASVTRGETRDQDEDIVRAPWRHGDQREQGSRTGRCGWITSFLRSLGTRQARSESLPVSVSGRPNGSGL